MGYSKDSNSPSQTIGSDLKKMEHIIHLRKHDSRADRSLTKHICQTNNRKFLAAATAVTGTKRDPLYLTLLEFSVSVCL